MSFSPSILPPHPCETCGRMTQRPRFCCDKCCNGFHSRERYHAQQAAQGRETKRHTAGRATPIPPETLAKVARQREEWRKAHQEAEEIAKLRKGIEADMEEDAPLPEYLLQRASRGYTTTCECGRQTVPGSRFCWRHVGREEKEGE